MYIYIYIVSAGAFLYTEGDTPTVLHWVGTRSVTPGDGALKKTELRSCVKVQVAVQGSPSLIVLMVSVDVNQT